MLPGPLGWIHAHFGLGLQAQLWTAALITWLLLGALVVGLEWLAWRLRADRADHAWTSLAWALRSWPAWLLWTLGVAAVACLGWPARDLPSWWSLSAFLPGALALASLPFFAFNAANLRGATPSVIWRWRWPGWPSVFSAIAYVLVIHSADAGIGFFGEIVAPDQRWVTLSLECVLWAVGLLWALVWQVAWLNRATASAAPAMRRLALAPRVVSAVVVQDLRYWLLIALFAVPLLAAAVATLFFIPQMAESMRYRGAELPAAWHALFVTKRFVSQWWWLAVVPLPWFDLVAKARLLEQLGTAGPAGATPPTHPGCDPASTAPPTA
jgi:hypothetical protein